MEKKGVTIKCIRLELLSIKCYGFLTRGHAVTGNRHIEAKTV